MIRTGRSEARHSKFADAKARYVRIETEETSGKDSHRSQKSNKTGTVVRLYWQPAQGRQVLVQDWAAHHWGAAEVPDCESGGEVLLTSSSGSNSDASRTSSGASSGGSEIHEECETHEECMSGGTEQQSNNQGMLRDVKSKRTVQNREARIKYTQWCVQQRNSCGCLNQGELKKIHLTMMVQSTLQSNNEYVCRDFVWLEMNDRNGLCEFMYEATYI